MEQSLWEEQARCCIDGGFADIFWYITGNFGELSTWVQRVQFGFSAGRINYQLLMEANKRLKPDGKRVLVFAGTPANLLNLRNKDYFCHKDQLSFNIKIFYFQKFQKKIKKSFAQIPGFEGSVPHPNCGWASMHQVKPVVSFPKVLKGYTRDFTDRPFLPSDFSAFVDNLRWCQEQNIHVIAFRMVSCPEMDAIENTLSHCNFNQIKQAVLNHGFTWIERPTGSTLQSIESNCYDASHLNESGAILFSHWLGKQLQKVKALR